MKWRIYYDDGNTRSHVDGLPLIADAHLGILVVAQRRSDGAFHLLNGAEYYLFDGEYWVPIGLNGLEDWTMNCLPRIKCVIKGRAIANGRFKEIYEIAKEDIRKELLD